MKFYKETLTIISNIVQNKEQVAVSSIASIVKPSTFPHILREFHEIKFNEMKYALNCVHYLTVYPRPMNVGYKKKRVFKVT